MDFGTQDSLLTTQNPALIFLAPFSLQLDGDSAPTSHWVDFKAVPAGRYELTVEVIGQTRTRAIRHLDFQVLGLSTEP